jgi:hypothetical protein
MRKPANMSEVMVQAVEVRVPHAPFLRVGLYEEYSKRSCDSRTSLAVGVPALRHRGISESLLQSRFAQRKATPAA